MSKEAWFRAFEARRAELEDDGVPDDIAYYRAADEAYDLMRQRIEYAADMARLRRKEGE